MLGRTPVTRWLGRRVRARYLRLIPVGFTHPFYLRVEILGCTGGEERPASLLTNILTVRRRTCGAAQLWAHMVLLKPRPLDGERGRVSLSAL